VGELSRSLEEIKKELKDYKAKARSLEISLKAEVNKLKDVEGKQGRDVIELKRAVNIATSEGKIKELRLKASLSDLGIELNTVKQEKIQAEHSLEDCKRQLEQLKEQFGKLTNNTPSEYLDIEENDEQEIDKLKIECTVKDTQILELQSRL